MSITIKDCLKLPSLSLGTVVAGKKGLDRIVSTISVVEFNFSDDENLTSNEFLISAFYDVRDDVDEQCRLIRKYKERGEVGLILFYAEFILGKLDERVIKIADQLDFPIIMLPGEDTGLRYSDVISEVMEAVIMDRNHSNFFINNTLERLAQLPVYKRSLNSPLVLSSEHTRSSFFLCDRNNNVIASSFWPKTKSFSLEDVFTHIENSAESDSSSIEVFKKEFSTKESIPLTLYGISKNKLLTNGLMEQVIEIIQIFAAIWNYNLNLTTKEALITALIENDTSLTNYLCSTHKIDITNYNSIAFLQLSNSCSDASLKHEILSKIQDLYSSHRRKCIIDIYGDNVVILYEVLSSSVSDEILLEELKKNVMVTPEINCITLIPKIIASSNIRSYYLKYVANIESIKTVFPLKKIYELNDLRFIENCRLIIQTPARSANEYPILLKAILDEKDPELLNTLSVYFLDANTEVKKTAEILYLHRNTIQYRLARTRELLGVDITKPPVSIHLYTELALHRILSGK